MSDANQTPQISFTEQELVPLTDFFNMVSTKAKFEVTLPEAAKLSRSAAEFVNHLKKCEAHIFEVVRHTKAAAQATQEAQQEAEPKQQGKKSK